MITVLRNRQNDYFAVFSVGMKVNDLNKIVGRNIQRIINEKGLSQNELAKLLGVQPPYVNSLIKGRQGLGKDMTIKLCDALKIKPYELYLEPETPVIASKKEEAILYKYREAEALAVAERVEHYIDYLLSQTEPSAEKKPKKGKRK